MTMMMMMKMMIRARESNSALKLFLLNLLSESPVSAPKISSQHRELNRYFFFVVLPFFNSVGEEDDDDADAIFILSKSVKLGCK